MEKYKLKFMLDYSCNCLWSINEKAVEKYGYYIDINEIGISLHTKKLSKYVNELQNFKLNPIYQPLPSFWSGEMHIYFQKKVTELFEKIKEELNEDMFSLTVCESAKTEMEKPIEIKKTNNKLNEFISNPIKYFEENNINCDTNTLEEEIKEEYLKNIILEERYLKI